MKHAQKPQPDPALEALTADASEILCPKLDAQALELRRQMLERAKSISGSNHATGKPPIKANQL
jgi:hypothetical protein